MPFENNNSNEQIKIDPSKQQEQIDRDFDAILKEYQDMSHEEQGEFIEAVANKDPHFKELYTELKTFFQDRVMNPENYDNHLKLEAVKKHIEGTELDNAKNEKITLEPNIEDLATLKAKFYRTGPDNELHSKYFTIANGENQKLATIKGEFDNWIIRARDYIDNKYQVSDEIKSEIVKNQEYTVKTETNLENNKSINLSEKEVKKLTDLGNQELQKINEQNEKIENKLLQISLIKDISLMYKEYLKSILGNIKFKIIQDKDERYEKQINIIENEIKNISNLTEYLNLLGNTDDLLDLNAEKLLNKLIVSEENIAKTYGFDQPISFLWNKNDSVEGVNNGYKEIRKMLSNSNITSSDIAKY